MAHNFEQVIFDRLAAVLPLPTPQGYVAPPVMNHNPQTSPPNPSAELDPISFRIQVIQTVTVRLYLELGKVIPSLRLSEVSLNHDLASQRLRAEVRGCEICAKWEPFGRPQDYAKFLLSQFLEAYQSCTWVGELPGGGRRGRI